MTNEPDTNVQEVESQEVVQPTEETTTTEEQETVSEDTVTLTKAEFTKLKRQAIAYKSQKEGSPTERKTNSSDINKDELYLIAEGFKKKDIEQLAVIAKGSGVSLEEARSSDLFKLYQEKQQAEARKAKAQLGVSYGSGFNPGGPAIKPGMTEAEHKAVWAKMTGK